MTDTLIKLVAVGVCLGALVASIAKSGGWFLAEFSQLEQWLGGDKVLHILVSMLCSFSVLLLVWEELAASRYRFWLTVVYIALFLSLDEGLQLLIPHRQFSWGDLSANWLGLLLAIGLWWLYSTFLQRRLAREGAYGLR